MARSQAAIKAARQRYRERHADERRAKRAADRKPRKAKARGASYTTRDITTAVSIGAVFNNNKDRYGLVDNDTWAELLNAGAYAAANFIR